MKLYTYQIAKLPLVVQRKIPYIGTTVKSGHKAFAPTWEMVWGSKNGTLSNDDYLKQYREMMRESQVKYKYAWDKLFSYDTVAIGCYCKIGKFCHRHILVEIIKEYCYENMIDFEYLGEIQ